MTTKGSLYVSIPIVKRFSAEHFSSFVKIVFFSRENGGLNIRFFFKTPAGMLLRGTASFDVFCVKVSVEHRDFGQEEEPKIKRNSSRP